MSQLTIFLGRLIGLFFILISLALLVQKQATLETVAELIHHRPSMLVLGMLALLAGLAMVLAHNIWSGGVLPVIVTLLGWITLVRSLVLLFVSPQTLDRLFEVMQFEQLFYAYLGFPLLLGLYLAYAGFTSSVPTGRRHGAV